MSTTIPHMAARANAANQRAASAVAL